MRNPIFGKASGFTSDIDYIKKAGLLGKALAFVKKYQIFPFKQLLDLRRRHALEKSMQYSFSSEPSPVAQAQIAHK
ncbi:hypothetical protein ACFQT0_23770 [Hymenobacter humi]|uniref:Uncharacterized protein n=1 Tax=Hymenobacter humi TaxID=1411620 RepID=A0ABW2UB30_9BACT